MFVVISVDGVARRFLLEVFSVFADLALPLRLSGAHTISATTITILRISVLVQLVFAAVHLQQLSLLALNDVIPEAGRRCGRLDGGVCVISFCKRRRRWVLTFVVVSSSLRTLRTLRVIVGVTELGLEPRFLHKVLPHCRERELT